MSTQADTPPPGRHSLPGQTSPRRHPAGQTPPPPRRPLKRAVLRILLECILILQVQTPDVSKLQKTYTTHSLVITYKYMYIVREDYILWPQPTFGIGPSTRPQFEIIHSLPVSGRISGIQVFVSVYLSQKCIKYVTLWDTPLRNRQTHSRTLFLQMKLNTVVMCALCTVTVIAFEPTVIHVKMTT